MFRDERDLGRLREDKEMARIEKRRSVEQERQKRIFDAKTRTIGVDTDALAAQIREKEEQKALEKERERYYDNQMLLMEATALSLEAQRQRERKEKLREIDEFRRTQQTKDSRREFDLNDPNMTKKELPARIGDNDERCGPSSLQKLHGEDLYAAERKKAQQIQISQWVESQVSEKNRRKQMEEEEERLYQQRMEEANYRAQLMEEEIRRIKKEMEIATKEFNLAQARAKRDEEEERRLKETLDNLEEIKNQLESDLLCENMETTLNVNDPTRFKKYHFKGLRPDQREEIKAIQEAQREALQMRRQMEKEDERAWAIEQQRQARIAALMERDLQRRRKEETMKLHEEHKIQATEKKMRTQTLNEIYKNEISEDFHNKFNTSSR